MKPVDRACKAAGGQAGMAASLGVTIQAVNQWVTSGRVPSARCIAVEEACGGVVTRYELRPDVFGSAAPELADKHPDLVPAPAERVSAEVTSG